MIFPQNLDLIYEALSAYTEEGQSGNNYHRDLTFAKL